MSIQKVVLRQIAASNTDVTAIMAETGLSEKQVRNAIDRNRRCGEAIRNTARRQFDFKTRVKRRDYRQHPYFAL
jgi:hypothetical protein